MQRRNSGAFALPERATSNFCIDATLGLTSYDKEPDGSRISDSMDRQCESDAIRAVQAIWPIYPAYPAIRLANLADFDYSQTHLNGGQPSPHRGATRGRGGAAIGNWATLSSGAPHFRRESSARSAMVTPRREMPLQG